MIAQFAIYPTDETHMSRAVAKMIQILEQAGIEYRLGPTSTAVEGECDAVMDAIRRCHQAALEDHDRVITTITLDDRRVPMHRLDEMVASVERHLGRGAKQVAT